MCLLSASGYDYRIHRYTDTPSPSPLSSSSLPEYTVLASSTAPAPPCLLLPPIHPPPSGLCPRFLKMVLLRKLGDDADREVTFRIVLAL